MRYDNAGNLVNDNWSSYGSATPGVATRSYDAENRMTSAQDSNGGTTYYTYDADGRRVRRSISGQPEVWQVYGLGGELLAEYAQNGLPSNPQKEYGYRNGQLLMTAATTAGSGGSAFSFSDDPLVVGTTIIKATHLSELRTAVNQARTHAGLAAASWAESVSAGVTIKASHITELRVRLDEARTALGLAAASYTDPDLTTGYTIKAAHIQELRGKTNEALTAGAGSSLDLRWLVSDQLGTPRMIFDQSGSLASTSRHDYLPFGEELFATIGGRTTAQGYTTPGYAASDGAREKFTLKERDNETGLDYFLARYYSSVQGRFTSPDEFKGGPDELYVLGSGDEEKQALPYAEIANPQSLNKYTYVYNNPLRFTDPDGHQGDDPITRLLRWFARQLDPQQEAEQPRRGPLSLDADKVNAQASQEMAKEGLRTMETLEKFGLDGGVTEMARQMDKKSYAGTAMAAAFMAFNIASLGRGEGGPLVKEAGEQLSKRFWIERGENVAANGIKMADWLAEAKNGSRGIVMEVFTGTNKSMTTVRQQLENGMAYLNSRGVKNVRPYVMVNSKRAATRVQNELGTVRGFAVKIIIGP
jgi:RHS repeat-associated protein